MKALAYSNILHIRVLRVNNVTQKSSKHFPASSFKLMDISLLHGKFWYLYTIMHRIIFGLQSVLYTKTASDTSLRIKYNALIALVVQNSGSYYCGRWWALPYSNPIKILSTCSSLHGLAYMCSRQDRNSLSVLLHWTFWTVNYFGIIKTEWCTLAYMPLDLNTAIWSSMAKNVNSFYAMYYVC